MLRQPIGVVGIVTPWNFPLLIGSERVPWAIGAGCCVVVKPSEFTSGSTIRMAELAREAGIPDGVINVVTGYGNPVGQLFAEHPACDMINFTGSFRVGQIVGGLAAARIKRVGLELGGKGPAIVFADANIDAAADTIARSIFGGQGQACISNSRMIVQREVKDAVLERLVHIASTVRVGDPLDARTQIGAMIHRPHLEKVEHYVGEGIRDGAGLVVGGRRLGNSGNYFAPTIFTEAGADMSVTRDEIFGPVLAVQTFDTPEQAIRLANDTNYGLSANVWTNDLGKAVQTIRAVRAGRTWINGAGTGGPEMGISGFRQSGMGRELGRHGFDEYSTLKNVYIVLQYGGSWV
jgi:acyl-CoA reductase-like NAD-dependent aldehyde dehydrogenase